MPYSITLDVVPVAKGRPRLGNGRAFTPAKTRLAEAEIRKQIEAQPHPTYEGPVGVILKFYLPRPKKPKHLLPIVRPDLDNYAKLVLDAVNGILWEDDSQVVGLKCAKLYVTGTDKPCTEIEIHSFADMQGGF